MIRRWLALTYYLYALRLAALSHFYFNPLYIHPQFQIPLKEKQPARDAMMAVCKGAGCFCRVYTASVRLMSHALASPDTCGSSWARTLAW